MHRLAGLDTLTATSVDQLFTDITAGVDVSVRAETNLSADARGAPGRWVGRAPSG